VSSAEVTAARLNSESIFLCDSHIAPALRSRRSSTCVAHFYLLASLIIGSWKQVLERWHHGERCCWRWWSYHSQSSKLYV